MLDDKNKEVIEMAIEDLLDVKAAVSYTLKTPVEEIKKHLKDINSQIDEAITAILGGIE